MPGSCCILIFNVMSSPAVQICSSSILSLSSFFSWQVLLWGCSFFYWQCRRSWSASFIWQSISGWTSYWFCSSLNFDMSSASFMYWVSIFFKNYFYLIWFFFWRCKWMLFEDYWESQCCKGDSSWKNDDRNGFSLLWNQEYTRWD